MAKFTIEKNKNYTIMSNYHLQDRNLSYKAKGLLSFMLSLPEDWNYSINGLVSISKEGVKAIKNILQELQKCGYLVIEKRQNEIGQFEYEYLIYEYPEYQKGDVDLGEVEKDIQINTNKQIDKDDSNFAALVFPKVIAMKRMYATITNHRYYSIGSYERLSLTEEFFKPKDVVFLDCDGTLNEKAPKACYIENKDNFIWLPGAIEAIKLLNDNKIITVLITNQPGIARGNFTIDTLNEIHDKMQSDLKEHDAHIDYIYYCPHNWDEGCFCRKPKPGMLYQAARDLSLNLPECTLFGDDERDIEAANAARCKGILITENYPLIEAIHDYLRDKSYEKSDLKRKIKKERGNK